MVNLELPYDGFTQVLFQFKLLLTTKNLIVGM